MSALWPAQWFLAQEKRSLFVFEVTAQASLEQSADTVGLKLKNFLLLLCYRAAEFLARELNCCLDSARLNRNVSELVRYAVRDRIVEA